MTVEQLKKAEGYSSKIESLQKEIDKWKRVYRWPYRNVQARVLFKPESPKFHGQWIEDFISTECIDIMDIRKLALNSLNKELDEIKKKLSKL